MTIYVDELPKSCEECPCCNECMDYGISCNLDDIKLSYYDYAKTRHSNCPLQSLSDYTKQVRKGVCEEIRKFIHSGEYDNFGIEYLRTGLAVLEKLDQIQGELSE